MYTYKAYRIIHKCVMYITILQLSLTNRATHSRKCNGVADLIETPLPIWVITSVVVKTFLGLETKTETLDFRSRDRDQDLNKMNSSLQTMVSRSQHWLSHEISSFCVKGCTPENPKTG